MWYWYWKSVRNGIDRIWKNEKLNILINFGDVIGENTQEHNPHWPQIADYLYRILIVGRSRSRKTNSKRIT